MEFNELGDFIIWAGTVLIEILVVLFLAYGTVFTVEQQNAAVIQRLGRFHRVAQAGLGIKLPIIDSIAGRVNLRIQQLDVEVQSITRDKVTVAIKISVQYFVIKDKVDDAFYKLEEPTAQITSYIYDTVRAKVPTLNLDAVFEKKDDIANDVKNQLTTTMDNYGYGIAVALVTDIDPAKVVKEAMNAINAAEREKVANENKGEAAKILTVKNAEAEAEKKHQSGLGVKMQRIAIAEGVKEAAALVKEAMPDLTDDQISEILFTNQYIDAITELTKSPNVKVMAFPLDPRAAGDIRSQFRDALIAARELPTDREITELAARTLEQKEGELKPSKEKIRK